MAAFFQKIPKLTFMQRESQAKEVLKILLS
jgi:hypothetical protein